MKEVDAEFRKEESRVTSALFYFAQIHLDF